MVRGELRRCVLWFLVSGFWGQGTPMAGKKASLTLRLGLRTIQPPENGKYFLAVSAMPKMWYNMQHDSPEQSKGVCYHGVC